jgi:threonine synthase
MKIIAYEIVEQLGWHAPDWYVQAVSGGLGPLGVHQGFKELFDMGLIDRIPKLAIIQTEGRPWSRRSAGQMLPRQSFRITALYSFDRRSCKAYTYLCS